MQTTVQKMKTFSTAAQPSKYSEELTIGKVMMVIIFSGIFISLCMEMAKAF